MPTKTQYGLFFSSRGETFRIPVNPTEWTLERDGDDENANILNVGPIIIPRTPKLAKIKWESWFPWDSTEPYVLTSGGFKNPQYYIDRINGFMFANEPVQFIASRSMEGGEPLFNTNMKVRIKQR